MNEKTRLLISSWRQQCMQDCLEQVAGIMEISTDRLLDFKAGFFRGWDACVSTMKLHEMLRNEPHIKMDPNVAFKSYDPGWPKELPEDRKWSSA